MPARYARANDDYGSIMVKALADRVAEAFAERMHERVRREFWAYARRRKLLARGTLRASLIAAFARRRAIRRSPITPKRRRSFELLDAEKRTGVKLTESFAMLPGRVGQRALSRASRARIISASPRSSAIRSRITRARKGMPAAEVERWLAPILNYEPAAAKAAE